MSILNRLFAAALEALLWPFRGLPPVVGLAFVALLTAVVVLLVYRRTSDQEGITAVRRKIVASLLEMRLFKDDLLVVFRAQGRVIKESFRYFRYSLVPLAWILVPLVILFMHMDRVYGYRALASGGAVIVSMKLSADATRDTRPVPGSVAESASQVALEAHQGLAVETPPLRIPNSNEVNWRIRGLDAGEHSLTARIGGHTVAKTVVVGVGRTPCPPTRPSSHILDQLLHPGEEPIPSEVPVQGITVHYRRATVSFLGWQVNWIVPFLLLTILFGFALQKPLGVKL